jgi:hypothetical protein
MARRSTARNRSNVGEQYSDVLQSLRALVALANADLEAVATEDLRGLVRGLLVLLPGTQPFGGGFGAVIQPAAGVGGAVVVYLPTTPGGATFDEAAARNEMRELWGPVRQVLAVKTATSDTAISAYYPLEAKFFVSSMMGNRTCVTMVGEFRDLVLNRMLTLLTHPVVSDRLRRCPECKAFFLRVRRQRFCSDRCKARVNSRRQKKRGLTDEQRLRRADRAHSYYEKAQHRLNPHAKVGRRPRLKPIPKSPHRRK